MSERSSTDASSSTGRLREQGVASARHDALDAAPGGHAEGLARRLKNRHPVTVAAIVAVVGYVIVGAMIVGLGLLLTHFLLNGALGGWDERANIWFVAQRTTSLNAVTSIGTTVGSTGTVIGVAAVSVVVLAILRWWREIGMIVIALAVEVLVFLMTTFLVNRPRPTVPRLDPSPPTSSFPSGHTAAAMALWISLAIVISVHVRNAFVRTVVWIVALGLPVFVAMSRLYRGMHHPTDVMASVVLGAGALVTALLAVRTASAVAEIRSDSPAADARSSQTARAEVAS